MTCNTSGRVANRRRFATTALAQIPQCSPIARPLRSASRAANSTATDVALPTLRPWAESNPASTC